jgi:hypothetical protein
VLGTVPRKRRSLRCTENTSRLAGDESSSPLLRQENLAEVFP